MSQIMRNRDNPKRSIANPLKYSSKAVITLLLFGMLGACGGNTLKPQQISSDAAKTTELEKERAISESRDTYTLWLDKLNDAEHLQLYSPSLYSQMLEDWSDAVDIYEEISNNPEKASEDYSFFSSESYAERFSQNVETVKVTYNKLTKLKEKADQVLAPSIEQMAYLIKINSEKHHPQRFQTINNHYKALFSYVEDDEIGTAQDKQSEFLPKAKQLEITTIQTIYLDPIERDTKKLEQAGISLQAPDSYRRALAKLDLAKETIKANPRELNLIEKAVASVRFEINHTLHIAAEVKKLKSTPEEKYEAYLLEIESNLLKIAIALSEKDYRDNTLANQSKILASEIKKLRAAQIPLESENDRLLLEVNHLKEEISTLRQKLEKLQIQNSLPSSVNQPAQPSATSPQLQQEPTNQKPTRSEPSSPLSINPAPVSQEQTAPLTE